MNNQAIFKLTFIFIQLFELAISIISLSLDNSDLDPAVELLPQPFDWETFLGPYIIILMILGLLVIAAAIASVVGVLLFKNWGRWLYLGTTLMFLGHNAFSGVGIYYGWESTLYDIYNMANGAIILAMFFFPISQEFSKASPSKDDDKS